MSKLDTFIDQVDFDSLSEVERACLIAFFYLKIDNVENFSASIAAGWISELGYPSPNSSRLAANLRNSKDVLSGSSRGLFRLHRTYVKDQEKTYTQIQSSSQTVADQGTILPEIIYLRKPGYIQSLSKQINASFENNIFDGCAVLMRRLEEVLLILSYEHLGISSSIREGNGNYLMLEGIVRDAGGNSVLNLSRNSRKTIETVRELGNFSAHKVTYICKREYIEETKNAYRALIDELNHKSGLTV